MDDITGTLLQQEEILKQKLFNERRLAIEKQELQRGQAGNIRSEEDRAAVLNNNQPDPHHKRIQEFKDRQRGIENFQKRYEKLSSEDRNIVKKRFENFQKKEFGDRDIYEKWDPLSPDHDKVQKELVDYGRAIEARQKTLNERKTKNDFNKEKPVAEKFIENKENILDDPDKPDPPKGGPQNKSKERDTDPDPKSPGDPQGPQSLQKNQVENTPKDLSEAQRRTEAERWIKQQELKRQRERGRGRDGR